MVFPRARHRDRSGGPDGDESRLFERLFQVEQGSQRSGGLGLGLFIVKGIVDAHGGTVGLTSEIGRGSTFHFEIPLQGSSVKLQ